jgi:adenylate cyclase
MDERDLANLAFWLTEAGLAAMPETELVSGFCERAVASGLPLARGTVLIDTLHPVYEGRYFAWDAAKGESTLREYGRSNEGPSAALWRTSPYYRLLETGEACLRRRLTAEVEAEFPIFADLRAAGMSDYVAMIQRFGVSGTMGDMDCVYASFVANNSEGFSERDVADLGRLMPTLSLAVKATSLARVAGTLVETYLGRDAGRRVLSGRTGRGIAEEIDAVLWFSDLRGYTRITDTAPPAAIIPLLNDYAEAIISAIHEAGGDVLKLIGDGTLAIFPAEERGRACRAALAAAGAARRSVAALNARRAQDALPLTDMYLGLHVGKVFYGNIGSKDRLDFTVVGPAVNEVSRIAAMCRSVDQPVLVSAAFASAIGGSGNSLVSVGRYALRGVSQPQDLYTIDPEAGAM